MYVLERKVGLDLVFVNQRERIKTGKITLSHHGVRVREKKSHAKIDERSLKRGQIVPCSQRESV